MYAAQYKGKEDVNGANSNTCVETISQQISLNAHVYSKMLLQFNSDSNNDFTTFADISVTKQAGTHTSELREYFQKPVENIKNPRKW